MATFVVDQAVIGPQSVACPQCFGGGGETHILYIEISKKIYSYRNHRIPAKTPNS